MLDETPDSPTEPTADASPAEAPQAAAEKPAKKAPAKRAPRKTAAKKAAAADEAAAPASSEAPAESGDAPVAKKATRKRAAKKVAAIDEPDTAGGSDDGDRPSSTAVLFQTPEPTKPARKRAAKKTAAPPADDAPADETSDDAPSEAGDEPGANDSESDDGDEGSTRRRPRRRGGRRRRKAGGDDESGESGNDGDATADKDDTGEGDDEGSATGSRRRRRRRRSGEDSGGGDDPENTVTRTRRQRNPEDEITSVSGSTRLEAKRQRRREGREAGRRRAPIVSEAEFLSRREAVDRVMVIRQRDELTQIGVLEDKVLVEHYVARESQTSLIGNVYLGRVQNVLPSMEAAFVDIGKGRNAVLYAGEVNWNALGAKDGQARKIESVLSSGQPILVQVSKDPIGHKGARLTSQVSLPGRFLVYVPDGTTSGISRKLPENERHRLKTLLKEVVPDTAGVIVRTAAEGASEEELTQDVQRLTERWSEIEAKVEAGNAPQMLYGEPDLTLKVVRDLFTEDFTKLVVQGEGAWNLVDDYVGKVAPDLRERLERYDPADNDGLDLFASYRLDEQIAKGLDRKVWLPSGGSLVIDRTEAMTVVDVNTGKFTGSGGNLEETVTKNNLEAAEEIVRQLRLRDIGGIIVIDFIDMVLESNRDLVLRRLVECLGRDRTRHQVAEVTSLGLVQMTRKRIGTGLVEAFSQDCDHCKGRGLVIHDHPIEPSNRPDEGERRGGRRARGGRGRDGNGGNGNGAPTPASHAPSPKDVAMMARHEPLDASESAESPEPAESADAPESVEADRVEITETEMVTAEVVEAEVVEAQVVETPEPEAVAPEPVAPEPEPEVAPEVAPEPEAPAVVTSTRRRTARRAAGPPVGGAEASVVTADQITETSVVTPDDAVVHVPVKRKGGR